MDKYFSHQRKGGKPSTTDTKKPVLGITPETGSGHQISREGV